MRTPLIACLGILPLAGSLPAQDWHETVAKACEHRRYGMRLAVSRKVAAAGDEAVPAIRSYAEAKGKDRVPLLLVSAVAGAKPSPKIGAATEALLEDWARDRGFFWRSQALGGLASRKLSRLRPLFRDAVKDPSHLFRIEGARGLALLDDDITVAHGLMESDPDVRVRARLAALLVERNDPRGLPVLVAALGLRGVFLGDPWGQREAKRALKALKAVAGEDFGYDVTATPEANKTAVEALRNVLRPKLPEWQEPTFRTTDAEFAGGFSVRSCRNGDLFVRWTADGKIVAGLEPEAPVQLPAAAWKPLAERFEPLAAQKGGVQGKVICDFILVQSVEPARAWKSAPGLQPADLHKWLVFFATTLSGCGAESLAGAITGRLDQFAETGAGGK